MVGPRSRCPGKNRKSLTIIPRLSRYQFSASRYFVDCTTRWPRRCTRAGTRSGTLGGVDALQRRCPTLKTCGVAGPAAPAARACRRPRAPASRWGRSGRPTGRRWTPAAAARRLPVLSASRSTSTSSPARNATPVNRVRGPRRTITHGAPASVPRNCSSSGRALCRLEAEGPRERLGAGQVGLLELQPGDVDDLDHRISGPAGVLAGERSLLAVQVLMASGFPGCVALDPSPSPS